MLSTAYYRPGLIYFHLIIMNQFQLIGDSDVNKFQAKLNQFVADKGPALEIVSFQYSAEHNPHVAEEAGGGWDVVIHYSAMIHYRIKISNS